jgi:dihydrofolate synthase/folylpolyglutamate synthase
MEAGYKTGLYTSPHFVKFNERVRVNGVEIPDEYIAEFITGMNSYIDKNRPTYFEITTALAFKYFSDNKIDIGVIEVGLGGRLDATNVLKPAASVITTISKEHTNILGDDLKVITGEKAGIIKEGTDVFVGLVGPESKHVLKEISKERNSECFFVENYVHRNPGFNSITDNGFLYNIYRTPLRGRYQIDNVSLAVFVLQKSVGIKDVNIISKGIQNVVENSGIQGRYEIINENPKVIFDSSHNEESINAFLTEFKNEYNSYDKNILIFGAMNDKEIDGSLRELNKYFDEIYFTTIEYERAFTIEQLMEISRKNKIIAKELNNPSNFIEKFFTLNKNNCLVLLGSIYLVGYIKTETSQKKA